MHTTQYFHRATRITSSQVQCLYLNNNCTQLLIVQSKQIVCCIVRFCIIRLWRHAECVAQTSKWKEPKQIRKNTDFITFCPLNLIDSKDDHRGVAYPPSWMGDNCFLTKIILLFGLSFIAIRIFALKWWNIHIQIAPSIVSRDCRAYVSCHSRKGLYYAYKNLLRHPNRLFE